MIIAMVMFKQNKRSYLTPNYAKLNRSSLILWGIISIMLPLGANAASVIPEQSAKNTLPNTVISLDLFDLFRNAIRYVQVASISEEEEVAIGKQINQKLLSQQYQLADSTQTQNYVD
ncbi:MAG TPA: hypothetical protein ACFCUY_12730, partial [Xenococcaceae cyanobacterium]